MWRVDSTHIQAIITPKKKQGVLLLFADPPTHFLLLLTEAKVMSIARKIRIQKSMKCLLMFDNGLATGFEFLYPVGSTA